jgi:threonylcarbamoyladenosine tRNA methylthiotransferase MtaB
MPSVGILSLGCKVNTYESEYIRNILEQRGYEIKDFTDKCDIYIINTCTVTNTSDTKSSKMLRRARKENPDAIIVAMGCFIESNKDNPIPGIDIVIGNRDKDKVPDLIDEHLKNKERIIRLYKGRTDIFEDMYITSFPGRTRAFVKIQDGCDNFCSYCIIPFVRGKCRSKDKDKVIEEITALVNNGYKEVVLTGIHTGSYGRDLDISFADLLNEIIKIEGLKRLRISSIEATELNEDILNILRNSDIIVDHLHIPLQAGSNEILKSMNRKYDLKYFEDKIAEIRSIRPDISITTDIIVGFPGETEELFKETLNTVRRINFSKVHVFPYSERKGTKSERLPNKIPTNIKKDYVKRLIELSKELEIEYASKFIGKELEILVEQTKDGFSYGHTSNYLNVKVKWNLPHNELIKVKITSVDYPNVIGEI